MIKKRSPSMLLIYPSCFHYPVIMERDELKTSQLWLGSYLDRYYPTTCADFEIGIGRPNKPTQIKRFQRKVRAFREKQPFDTLAGVCFCGQ